MNILLISTNRSVHPVPVMPIGACAVAEACERAGHRVRLLDLMFEKDPLRAVGAAVMDSRPDVVGISIRNIDNNDMRDPVFYLDDLPMIVNTIRGLTGAPVILGGAALGVMPEETLRFADISCGVTADGETVFPRLLARIDSGEPVGDLPGLALLDHDTFTLNPCSEGGGTVQCTAPDYHRWVNVAAYRAHLATAPVQTKLGCSFRCIYCTYRKLEGGRYRLAEPGAVAEAVTRLVVTGMTDIEFVDSVFNAPRDHALSLCEALGGTVHRARLQSLELNPALLDNELVTAMEEAGFVGMGVTAESAADQVLQGLGKGFTAAEVHRSAEVVRRHRIPCAWIFLLGGPGETQETVRETLRFAAQTARPQDVAFFNVGIRIYPGTELERTARDEGSFHMPPAEMLRPLFYISPAVSATWIIDEIKRSMAHCMNFISVDSIGLSFLPAIHRLGYRLGVRPPLWRYTRIIRRGLRMLGMDV
jgi:radical SAM superfamily enzyme YgiQ (UPF0313 family)